MSDINVFGCAAFLFVPVAIFLLALAFRRSPAENTIEHFKRTDRWN